MRTRRAFLLAAAVAPTLPTATIAAPRARLLPHWQAHDPDSAQRVDHDVWGAFLDRHLVHGRDGVNRIDYRGAMRSRTVLGRYLDELSGIRVGRLRRDEQFAYWVNLYNALTVATVLEHYPVDSIRDIDISGGLFSDGPWGAELVRVEGRPLSLDDIEHGILRPIWRDARVHYAVNCAAIGCPNLGAAPFSAATLERQLEAAARAFVTHPRGARIDGGRLYVSSIYRWYESDFGGSEIGVITHLARYAASSLSARLDGLSEIAGYAYDWSLADVERSPAT